MELVLASSSPRRQELLQAAGIPFTVYAANVPEELRKGEAPQAFAERLAYEKADAVWQQHPDSLVLGADTIVVVDKHVLGKPAGTNDAKRMLEMISGRTHKVMTGVCLLGTGMRKIATASTQVRFAAMSAGEIDDYIATGEPMDKAGAYGIQGVASRWVPWIGGDYTNVVGLPVPLVYEMLRQSKFPFDPSLA